MTEDKNLEILIQDLRPFADKPVGSIRIDMSDVRSILRLYDGNHPQADEATVERAVMVCEKCGEALGEGKA